MDTATRARYYELITMKPDERSLGVIERAGMSYISQKDALCIFEVGEGFENGAIFSQEENELSSEQMRILNELRLRWSPVELEVAGC